ncbi:MAG TPA: histidine phosphatase family protein [Terracidiphilus sp.]|nr:histidine phosphatase family protein [Terracidiphilus sp.]
MKSIILVRHAETAMAGKFCGHADPDLNAAGEMQLPPIVEGVVRCGIDRIIASDLRRALRTAQAIGCEIGVEPQLRPQLREIHFGLWEGLTWAEITERYPREVRTWLSEFPKSSAPDGEPYATFCERIEAEFKLLIDSLANQTTAVITHAGPMRFALTKFFGWSEQDAFEQTAAYGAVVVVPGMLPVQGVLP